jgi:hypothetical protein
MTMTTNGLAIRTPDDLERIAKMAVSSGLCRVKRWEEAAFLLATGGELGLSPMQSLRGIYVVNGTPVLSADLLVAIVRRSGLCDWWRVDESTAERCTITTQRKGEPTPASKTWTLADAKRAGVTGKQVWSQYPAAMLRHRCAADLVREQYPDVALGLYDPEELGGEPQARDAEPVVVAPPLTPRGPSARELNALGVEHPQRAPLAEAPAVDPEREAIQQETDAPAYTEAVDAIELPGEAVAVWMKHRDAILALSADDQKSARQYLAARVAHVGKMAPKAAALWLAKAIKEEDARRAAAEGKSSDAAA